MSQAEQKIRWGILGTARIATKVGKAIRGAAGAELAAIASRSSDRAADWAAEHGATRSYGSYEALLDDPGIQAVYVPLPPALHVEWTIRAAERGKHVLCEKPLARNAHETREMAAACREHDVQLMDGVMWLHHPRTADMARQIQEGALGRLRRVTSSFTFHWATVPMDDIRLSREMGGGSLLDLGWYCVGATLWAFGDMPRRVYGTARFCNDVDMNFSGMMWFDDERMASFDCGFDTEMRKWFEVAGTEASLVCDDFTNPWDVDNPRFWLHNSTGTIAERIAEPIIQEVRMIEDFGVLVRSGELDPHWPETAIATQRVCDALDQSARTGQPVEV